MLNLLLLAGRSHSLTTDPNFDVISCNNEDSNLPELTLSIKQEYLNTYLSWLTTQVGFLIPYNLYAAHNHHFKIGYSRIFVIEPKNVASDAGNL